MSFEDRTEKRLNDHSERIRTLEKSDAQNGVIIQQLCKKMDSLINWIKALIIAMLGVGGGFIIWYIQSLPR